MFIFSYLWGLPNLQTQQDSITEDSKTNFPLCREAKLSYNIMNVFSFLIIMYSFPCHYKAQAGLKQGNLPAFPSQVLCLQVSATMPIL